MEADTLNIIGPEFPKYGDTVRLSIDGVDTTVTVGSTPRKLYNAAKGVVTRVTNRLTLDNFIFFVLSRFHRQRPEAVRQVCAYALSTFDGLPQYLMTQDECKQAFASLSKDLAAELKEYDAAIKALNPKDSLSEEEKTAVRDTAVTELGFDDDDTIQEVEEHVNLDTLINHLGTTEESDSETTPF